MKDYLTLLLAALLLAGDFAISKLYQARAGTSLKAGFAFNACLGLFTALIFWGMNGFVCSITPYSVILSALLSALGMSYTLFGFRILKSGGMALYSLFLMTGGMAIPYLWGLLFLNESFSWLRTAGLCVLIFAVMLSNLPQKGNRTNAKLLLMCVAVFVLNGLVSVISKVHQTETVHAAVGATEFVMLSGICKCIISGGALVAATVYERKKTLSAEKKKNGWALLPLIALSAAVGGVSYLLQLMGASNLPATVLYPFITGGSMIFSSIVGVLAFREKLSGRLMFSILLCFIGTLMFL